MKALVFSEATGLQLQEDRDQPKADGEALIAVRFAGICSTDVTRTDEILSTRKLLEQLLRKSERVQVKPWSEDLEILKGYVPDFDGVIGHEFVGTVKECKSRPELEGKRVVGEINCPQDTDYSNGDPIFMRNHYPRRTVLGIIARDGAMAEYTSLPAANLFEVPDAITDKEAVFTEPLAAACRVLEQQVIKQNDKVVIIGDGKLGLLVAQIIALQTKVPPVHVGRHQEKLDLVEGTTKLVLGPDAKLDDSHKQAFDVCIEASGSSKGILLAMELTRPLGTVVQKSTCSAVGDPEMPDWSSLANDIVVNEKHLMGSRCGPFSPALQALQLPAVKQLVEHMVTAVYPISEGKEAIEKAKAKGSLKVLLELSS